MSVLKSKRHISTFEYENTFTILYQFSAEQTSKVPLRKQKWLCAKIDEIMNNSYELIMELNECYFSKEKEINSEEILHVEKQRDESYKYRNIRSETSSSLY